MEMFRLRDLPPGKTTKSEMEKGIFVMGFQAPLSFLNAYVFRRGVLDAIKHKGCAINLLILEASQHSRDRLYRLHYPR